jgi:L-gulonolactone oxidase
MEWEPYFRSFRSIAREHEGRPHWGKRHFETVETLAGLYPEWPRFQDLREQLDPEGTFTNDYIRRVLGVKR